MNIADLLKLIYFVSIIIWVLPALRQYKTEFFDYFLILALIDPIAIAYGVLTRSSIPTWVTVFFAYLLIISLLSESNIKKLRYVLIIIPVIYFLAIPFIDKKLSFLIILIENIIIFLFFLKFLITDYVNHQRIKLFLFILCFYELTVILKVFNLIIGFANANSFYFITGIAQILFGLFFSIVREDESRVIV